MRKGRLVPRPAESLCDTIRFITGLGVDSAASDSFRNVVVALHRPVASQVPSAQLSYPAVFVRNVRASGANLVPLCSPGLLYQLMGLFYQYLVKVPALSPSVVLTPAPLWDLGFVFIWKRYFS